MGMWSNHKEKCTGCYIGALDKTSPKSVCSSVAPRVCTAHMHRNRHAAEWAYLYIVLSQPAGPAPCLHDKVCALARAHMACLLVPDALLNQVCQVCVELNGIWSCQAQGHRLELDLHRHNKAVESTYLLLLVIAQGTHRCL